jgi:hypothetical protein
VSGVANQPAPSVDTLDQHLLAQLRINARMSNATLAKKLSVSRGTIASPRAARESRSDHGYTVRLRPEARPQEIKAWVNIAVEGDRTREVVKILLGEPALTYADFQSVERSQITLKKSVTCGALHPAFQADQGIFHAHPISLRHRPGPCAVQHSQDVWPAASVYTRLKSDNNRLPIYLCIKRLTTSG